MTSQFLFQSVPNTAYFKLIDYWFVFSLNVFIVSFVFHTVVGSLAGRTTTVDNQIGNMSGSWKSQTSGSNPQLARVVNNVGKIAFFLLIVIFNVSFWAVAMYEANKNNELFGKCRYA
jgi:hypothetical protein